MANPDHIAQLQKGLDAWNAWRAGETPNIYPDLSGADLNRAKLRGANLSGANLSEAELDLANLNEANLSRANLGGAFLCQANLSEANLNRPAEAKFNQLLERLAKQLRVENIQSACAARLSSFL